MVASQAQGPVTPSGRPLAQGGLGAFRKRRDGAWRHMTQSLRALRQVIVSGFESGELPATSAMVPVLARLLEFTPADLKTVAGVRPKSWMDGLPALPSMSGPP